MSLTPRDLPDVRCHCTLNNFDAAVTSLMASQGLATDPGAELENWSQPQRSKCGALSASRPLVHVADMAGASKHVCLDSRMLRHACLCVRVCVCVHFPNQSCLKGF